MDGRTDRQTEHSYYCANMVKVMKENMQNSTKHQSNNRLKNYKNLLVTPRI